MDNIKDNIPSDSISKRYLFTLGTNLARLFIGFITAGLVPRALGPVNYGNFNFLISSFNTIRRFLDLSASSAFFTRSSQKLKTDVSFLVYLGLLGIQVLLIALLIGISWFTGYSAYLWPGQNIFLIWIVAGLVFIQFIRREMVHFGDSKGLTIWVRSVDFCCQLGMVFLILYLFFKNRLNLYNFIKLNYTVCIIFTIVVGYAIFWRRRKVFFAINKNWSDIKSSLSYFKNYCSPLVVYSLGGFFAEFFRRWFLQLTGGSEEQGFYSLAFRWSGIVLIFTTSILTIYWREIANSFAAKDIKKTIYLYKKCHFLLYAIAAYIALFLSSNAGILVKYIAKDKFMAATIPFMIMAFYPLHQTYGQLNGSFYLATERTRTYRTIGIIAIPFHIIAIYLVLAPKNFIIPGMNLGALGLAIQMVGLQFIFINIYLFVNCRFLKINYMPFLLHQVGIVLLWGIVSIFSRFIIDRFMLIIKINSVMITFILNGVLYSAIVGIIIVYFPILAGMKKGELKNRLRTILKG
jgi:O-antigen/teichoic acid export membrane protein